MKRGLSDDLCPGADRAAAESRGRLLAWLASGAQPVAWAICGVDRARWFTPAPEHLARAVGDWPAAWRVRHLALSTQRLWLPAVRAALGDLAEGELARLPEPGRMDAAWDGSADADAVRAALRTLAEGRFDMLRRLEAAPDEAWERPLPALFARGSRRGAAPVGLGWLVARAYQEELEHLAALWALALYWDRAAAPPERAALAHLQC